FNVYIVTNVGGAYHANCAATEMHCGAAGTTTGDTVRMLVVAEEEEVFEAAYTGWGCGQSHGEALSRVMAEIMYPAELDGYAAGAVLARRGQAVRDRHHREPRSKLRPDRRRALLSLLPALPARLHVGEDRQGRARPGHACRHLPAPDRTHNRLQRLQVVRRPSL